MVTTIGDTWTVVIVRPSGRALGIQFFYNPNKFITAGKKGFTKVYLIARVSCATSGIFH